MEVIRDEQLWRIAKKRAAFKKHLATYIIVNGFLWALWYVTVGHDEVLDKANILEAWPIWSTLGWGIGLALNYVGAYHQTSKEDAVQREYEKLRNARK
ncbi:MAG: 2TM domain-containing protein [Bacteroidetes bacterium]|nr:2TM domain-containing protein [Bacteroidota bacterium]